jgi:hypothetical protein
MENIANIVDMLNGAKTTEEKKEQIDLVKKLQDPTQTKKSFEMRMENDDDDEIFIVHEEEDDNQASLFAEGAF